MKVHIKEKFRRFVLPKTTSMRPPPKKVTIKGSPKKNKHFIRSKKRLSSIWEIVDSQEQQVQASQTNLTRTSGKRARKSNMSPKPPKPTLLKSTYIGCPQRHVVLSSPVVCTECFQILKSELGFRL